MIHLLPDWKARFTRFIQERRPLCYDKSTNDCVRFSADLILACTEYDLAAKYRGRYKTDADGVALVKEEGGLVQMVRGVCREAGMIQIEVTTRPVHTRMTDLALVKDFLGREGVAVCDDLGPLTVIGQGITRVSSSRVLEIWRIPNGP